MFVFKEIDTTTTEIKQNVVNYVQNFTTSSHGIKSINIISGSVSQSYWNSLNVLFYTSGSPIYPNEHKFGRKFQNSIHINQKGHGVHLNKFHGYPSSSIIQIPQQYYGEKIREKSFVLRDLNFTDNNGQYPEIRDDGIGNLYAYNAHHSQSTTSPSSSENYVGNIFYDKGLAVITETGSWSGSVNYPNLANNSNFTVQLQSYDTITTHEYSVTIEPQEFNHTLNKSIRVPLSGSYKSVGEYTSSIYSNPYVAKEVTSSNFNPYITTINLYNKGDNDTPVMTATFPKPIKVSKKIPMTFKIKYDF